MTPEREPGKEVAGVGAGLAVCLCKACLLSRNGWPWRRGENRLPRVNKALDAKHQKHAWSSLVVQWVKDPALSLLWLRSLRWCGFSPWLRKFHMPRAQPKRFFRQDMLTAETSQVCIVVEGGKLR